MLTPAQELAAAEARIRGYNDALLKINTMFGKEHQTAAGIQACIAEAEKKVAGLQSKVVSAHSEHNLKARGYAGSNWEAPHGQV